MNDLVINGKDEDSWGKNSPRLFELIITSNRPEIFKLFLNEFPEAIESYLKLNTMYFLYNFKNQVLYLTQDPFFSPRP